MKVNFLKGISMVKESLLLVTKESTKESFKMVSFMDLESIRFLKKTKMTEPTSDSFIRT